jgi:hypothetical protein
VVPLNPVRLEELHFTQPRTQPGQAYREPHAGDVEPLPETVRAMRERPAANLRRHVNDPLVRQP